MKLTRRQLRRIISEAISDEEIKKWAKRSKVANPWANRFVTPKSMGPYPPEGTVATPEFTNINVDWTNKKLNQALEINIEAVKQINPQLATTIADLNREYFNQFYELTDLTIDDQERIRLNKALENIAELYVYQGWVYKEPRLDDSYERWQFGMNIRYQMQGEDALVWKVEVEGDFGSIEEVGTEGYAMQEFLTWPDAKRIADDFESAVKSGQHSDYVAITDGPVIKEKEFRIYFKADERY